MTRKHLLAAAALVLLFFAGMRAEHLNAIAGAPKGAVLIAYESGSGVRAQWDAVLVHRGTPHEWVSVTDFAVLDGSDLARRFSLIVIPREIVRAIPDAARAQFAQFAAAGGRIVTSPDPQSLLQSREAGASHRPLASLSS